MVNMRLVPVWRGFCSNALGSNLSIMQIRQDFSKNLTLAGTNEEAANSQALSTRQSIAVSPLALANQSQQSVLQILRQAGRRRQRSRRRGDPAAFLSGEKFFRLEKKNAGMKKSVEADNLGFDLNSIRTDGRHADATSMDFCRTTDTLGNAC
jgi:hypothetical protein